MKKLFYLFLLPLVMLVSCDDDKNLSPVDLTLTLNGVTQVDNVFYTVAGEDVSIDGLEAKAVDGKATALDNVVVLLDGEVLFGGITNNYLGSFTTAGLGPGTYYIDIAGNLLQVDSSIQTFVASYPLTIVDSEDDLPAMAPELGIYSSTITLSK